MLLLYQPRHSKKRVSIMPTFQPRLLLMFELMKMETLSSLPLRLPML
jgi:hypothetical protein